MYCPRVNHFVRFNANGTVSRCGHMVNAPQFINYHTMENSEWMRDMVVKFNSNEWPAECVRCQKSEAVGEKSIREYAIDEWKKPHSRSDYLQVGGVLDNICNAACQTCSENHSSVIAGLKGIKIKVDNSNRLDELPWDRITHLDLNGGEPSASPAYKKLLENPPPNLMSLRLNTNCTRVLWDLGKLADNDVEVTVTVSLDGVGRVHEYMRWPITWQRFLINLKIYQSMPVKLNTWTTVSALNIGDFNNIVEFTKTEGIDHAWAFLERPNVLSVAHSNPLTTWAKLTLPEEMAKFVAIEENNQAELDAYIAEQDGIRSLRFKDFIK